jgi:integrase
VAKRRAKGEGTIYYSETQELWVAQITLPNGRRKSKYSKTQKVVRDWLLEKRKSLKDGLLVESENITVEQFFDRFMNDVAAHTLRTRTIESYTYLINKHIKPEIGPIKLAKLCPDHLQNLYSQKLDEGLSERTVHYIHAVIRRILNQAVKWGLIVRSVTDLVEPPKPKKRIPKTLSEGQAKKFLETVKDHRWYPLYVLAITTGMRQGELLGLHWEDVDLERSVLHVRHALQVVVGQGLELTQPKTEKAKRTVALSDFAVEVIHEYEKEVETPQGLMFATSSGKPVSPRNVLRHFHETLEKAGLPRMRFHDLRHTAASLLLKEQVHPKVVQEMLGHSTITLTLDTYSHVIPDIQQEAAEKMDSIFQ